MSAEQAARGTAGSPEAGDARIPVRGDALVHQVHASEQTVLFTRDRSELLLLNDMGAGIWFLINGRRSVEEIVEIVAAYFPDAEDRVESDVDAFLMSLREAGALRFA